MSGKQRIVLLLTAISMIIATLFPPYQLQTPKEVTLNLGYGFLFDPPMYSKTVAGSVNVGLLIAEILVIFLVGGMVAIMLKEGKDLQF